MVKKKSGHIIEYIKSNYKKFGDEEIAAKFGISKRAVRKYKIAAGVIKPEYPVLEFSPQPLSRSWHPAAAALFVLILFVYCRTLAPTIYPGLSGEMITASFKTGLAHPPGFVFQQFAAKILSALLPGNIALKYNFFNAAVSALTAVLLFFVVSRMGLNFIAAISTTVLYAFSPLVWDSSAYYSSYPLEVGGLLCAFYSFLLYFEKRDIRKLYLYMFAAGVSLTQSPYFLILLLPLVYVVIGSERKRQSFVSVLKGSWLLVIPSAAYIYTLAGAGDPDAVWKNTSGIGELASYFWSFYKRIYDMAPQGAGGYFKTLVWGARALLDNSTPIFLAAGAYGIARALIRRTASDKILAAWFAMYFLIMPVFAVYDDTPETYYLFRYSVIFSCVLFFMLAGEALSHIASYAVSAVPVFFKSRRKLVMTTAAVMVSFACFPGSFYYSSADRSDCYGMYDTAYDFLLSVDPGAAFIIDGDQPISSVLYVNRVENIRKDAAIFDRTGKVFWNTAENLKKKTGSAAGDTSTIQALEGRLIRERAGDKFFVSKKSPYSSFQRPMKDWGLIYKLRTKDNENETRTDASVWDSYLSRGFGGRSHDKDIILRKLEAEYFYKNGTRLLASGNRREGLRQMQLSSDLAGDDFFTTHYNIAVELEEAGFLKEAAGEYLLSLKIKDDFEDALNNIAGVYDRLNQTDKAIETYGSLIKINPKYYRAYSNLGTVYEKKKDFEAAVSVYKEAIRLFPAYQKAMFNLATLYDDKKQHSESLKLWEKLAKMETYQLYALKKSALIHMKSGNIAKAEKHWEKVLELKPSDPDAGKAIGIVRNKGRAEIERSAEELMSDLSPSQKPSPVRERFKLLMKEGIESYNKNNLQDALKKFTQAYGIFQDSSGASFNLGTTLLRLNRTAEAETYLKKALQIDPGYKLAVINLANVYYRTGRYDLALDMWKKLLDLEPGSELALKNISELNKWLESKSNKK